MPDRVAHAIFCLLLAAGSASAAAGSSANASTTYCGGSALDCIDPPMIGAVLSTEAVVWVHLGGAGKVRVRYEDPTVGTWVETASASTSAASDNTAKFSLAGLTAATTYAYEIGITQADGGQSWSPDYFFRTADAQPAKLVFSVLTDFANNLSASPALQAATATRNDFVLFIGDMDHRGPARKPGGTLYPPGSPEVLADMRRMHQNMRNPDFPIGADFYNGLLTSSAVRPQTPFFYAWDDHDYCANNEDDTCPSRDTAIQTYRENYLWAADSAMSAGSSCSGDFQHLSYGTLLDVIMLDGRSNRDLTTKPPTMLGSCQLNWLLGTLRAAKGTWKFLLSPVTFNPTTKPYDAWGGFPEEHQQILDAIAAGGIRNVIVLSGDIHSGGAYDDGTHAGLPELTVPHANMPATWVNTYCRRRGNGGQYMLNEPGTWTIGSLAAPNTLPVPHCMAKQFPGAPVVTPTPPPYPLDGAGASGYARVELTPTMATVSLVGADGVVRSGVQADGSPASLSLQFGAK